MYICRFQKVRIDLIEISDGAKDMGADVALVIEGLKAAKDSDIGVLL